MLKNEIKKDELFNELTEYANGLSMVLIDAYKNVKGPSETQVCITVMKTEGETGIDELAAFHRAVQPRLELEIGREVLSMEVSSPGLQRVFKDYWEFEVFKGKRCRVYSQKYSSWVEGTIKTVIDQTVVFDNCLVIDINEVLDTLTLSFEDIQKAKLEYKWENKKSGDKK